MEPDRTSDRYRYHSIDSAGQLQETAWLVAASDAEALAHVAQRNPRSICEVWQGARMVGTVGPGSGGDEA